MSGTLLVAAGAGVASSIGPCVAPRYLALLAAVSGQPVMKRVLNVSAFVLGTMTGYALLASAGAALGSILQHSEWLYALMAIALIAGSMVNLRHAGYCHAGDGTARSAGALFLLGTSSALVVSPCCTPIIVTLGAFAGQNAPAETFACAVAFLLGHLSPMLLAIPAVRLPFRGFERAASVVGSGLMFALGAFYGLLA